MGMAHIEFCGALAVVMTLIFILTLLYALWITSKHFTLKEEIKQEKREKSALRSENSYLEKRVEMLRRS